MDILTADEAREMDFLHASLLERVEEYVDSIPFARYLTMMHKERKLDLLRCMDQFLTSGDRDLFFSIERSQEISSKYMNRAASGFLTSEMVAVESRINDHLVFGPVFKTAAFVFENMEHADMLLYLIEDRGVTDIDELSKATLRFKDHTKSLLGGVL